MCQQLTMLCDFVSLQPVTASPTDVIRIACGVCAKTDVCAYVTSDEFDEAQPKAATTPELSQPTVQPSSNRR